MVKYSEIATGISQAKNYQYENNSRLLFTLSKDGEVKNFKRSDRSNDVDSIIGCLSKLKGYKCHGK